MAKIVTCECLLDLVIQLAVGVPYAWSGSLIVDFSRAILISARFLCSFSAAFAPTMLIKSSNATNTFKFRL